MIYTGYYAYTGKYKDNGLTTVAISRTIPSFYEGYKLEMFAPSMDLLYECEGV